MARSITVAITGQTVGLARALSRAQAQTTSFGARTGKVLGAVSKAGVISLGLLGGASVKAAIQFESSFASVKKTVEGTPKQLDEISDSIRNLAKTIPASVNELNEIAASAGALGIKREAIVEFTRVIADMGETTNLVGEDAAATMARLANITRMPQTEFDKLGSTIVDLGNKGASTEKEIAEMGLRIAAAGQVAGMSVSDVLGLANAFSSVGMESERGGTAISTAIQMMDKAVATGGERLQNFANVAGMSAQQFSATWRSEPVAALEAFLKGLWKIEKSGGNTYGVLDQLKMRAKNLQDAMVRGASASDLISKSVDDANRAWKEGTALQDEAAKRYETTAAKLETMKNRFVDMGISVGQAVIPAILTMLPHLEEFGRRLGELGPQAEAAGRALGTGLRVGGAIAGDELGRFGLTAVATSLVFGGAVNRMITMFGKLKFAMTTGHPVLTAVSIAVGLLAGGFITLGGHAQTAADRIKSLTDAMGRMKSASDAAKNTELALAEAKNRLKAASLQVTQAIKTKQQAQEQGGKTSLAYKQAENQVEAAYIARRRAAMDVEAATKANTKATDESSKVNLIAKTSVERLAIQTQMGVERARAFAEAQGWSADKVKAFMKQTQDQAIVKFIDNQRALAKRATELGESLEKSDPKIAATQKQIAKAATEAANFAQKTGTIPPAISKVTPQAKAAMAALAEGVRGEAERGGSSVGSAFGAGVAAGIASQTGYAAALAESLVLKANAAARAAARAKSPSQLTMLLGQDFVEGFVQGIVTRIPRGVEAMRQLSLRAAAGFDSSRLIAQLDQAAARWQRYGAALTPVEAQLAKMAAAEELRSLQRGIRDAREAVADARKVKDAKERAQRITEANQQLATAEAALTTYRLEQVAARERAGRDKQVAIAVAGIEKLKTEVQRRIDVLNTAFEGVAGKLERAFGAKTQAMVTALGKTFDAQIDKVRKWQQELTAGEQALKAFEDTVSKQGATASELELERLDASEAERERQRALAAAQQGLEDARNMALTEQTDQKAKNEAILAAEEQLRSAELAITRARLADRAAAERAARDTENAERRVALEQRAAEERRDRDEQAALQIEFLEGQKAREIANLEETRALELVELQKGLAQLQRELAKRPGEHAKINAKVVALMKKAGVDMTNAGENLGEAFAKGLSKAEGEVAAAAKRLAAIPASYLKLKSPAEKGPLAELDTFWTKFGSTLVQGLDHRGLERAVERYASLPAWSAGGPFATPAGASRGGGLSTGTGSGGAVNLVVQFHGPTYADERGIEELTRKIRDALQKTASRNSYG